MSSSAERRVRRPSDKEEVLSILTAKENGSAPVFRQLRDAMVFAAALGWSKQRRAPFNKSGEPIRWDVASNRRGTELLVNLLAIASSPDDAEILGDDRFDDRILIFEEYVNGGLGYLQDQLRSEVGSPTEVVLRLVESAMSATNKVTPIADLDELLDEIV
jgi:dnd system-associated protein 4